MVREWGSRVESASNIDDERRETGDEKVGRLTSSRVKRSSESFRDEDRMVHRRRSDAEVHEGVVESVFLIVQMQGEEER